MSVAVQIQFLTFYETNIVCELLILVFTTVPASQTCWYERYCLTYLAKTGSKCSQYFKKGVSKQNTCLASYKTIANNYSALSYI